MKKTIVSILVCTLLILGAFAGFSSAKCITSTTERINDTIDVFHLSYINEDSGSFEFTCDAGGPYFGYVGEPIQFDGSASGGYEPYYWEWDFNDGTYGYEQDPVHVYEFPGTYLVILHVTDSYEQCCWSEAIAVIESEPDDIEDPEVTITYPEDGAILFVPDILVTGYFSDDVGVIILGGQHWWEGGYAETGDNLLPEPCLYCNFDWEVTLREGENTLTVYAIDEAGNEGEDTVTVVYTEEVPTIEEVVKELDKVIDMLNNINDELDKILAKLTDTDKDGIPDDVDLDRDGDGVPNRQDKYPDDPTRSRDTDGDGKDDTVDPNIDGEDNNGNGKLDPGEDANGNGKLDGDSELNGADTDDDGDGNSDEFENVMQDNLQKLKNMRDPAVDAAIDATEALNPGGGADLFRSGTLAGTTMGVTTYSGAKPNIQAQITIDLEKHRNPDGSIDEDEKLDTMLHEMRHCYQTWLIQQTEVTLGRDLDGDGKLEGDVTNDEDDDWLPGWVPPGMDDEGDLQDDDDSTAKPWDPDNDGDHNDDDAYGKRDKDARDFARKKLNEFKNDKWNWKERWLKDIIAEINSVIQQLTDAISELDNISEKLDKLDKDDEKEKVDDEKEKLEKNKSDLEKAVKKLEGYLPGKFSDDYPEWWYTLRGEILTYLQNTKQDSLNAQDTFMDMIFDNGYKPALNVEDGSFSWTDVSPGSELTASFTVENTGDIYSRLNWEISEYPTWGTWVFMPSDGKCLGKNDGSITVQVTITAPNEKNEDFGGQIKIVNKDDPNDYETIPITLTTSKNKNVYRFPLIQRFQENHPRIFTLLLQLSQLLVTIK